MLENRKSYRLFALTLFCLLLPAAAPCQSDELLFAKRIVSFWKDGEGRPLKGHIKKFLADYPESRFRDSFLILLGDTCREEEKYEEALAAYGQIRSPRLKQKTEKQLLDCLLRSKNYEALLEKSAGRLPPRGAAPGSEEEALALYYFAEASRGLCRYDEAKEAYRALSSTSYALRALLGMAELNAALNRHSEAAGIYLELTSRMPEKESALLFLAGKQQAKYAPQEALLTFSKAQQKKGSHRKLAALHKAALLYDDGQHKQLLAEYETLKKTADAPLLDLLAGKSRYKLEEYNEAAALLERACEGGGPYKKEALFTLAAARYCLGDEVKMEEAAASFKEAFPDDPLLARLYTLRALYYRGQNRLAEARICLNRALKEFPGSEKSEQIAFEIALLDYKLDKWEESRDGFLRFIEDYPESGYRDHALALIPAATQQKIDEEGGSEGLRGRLIDDIRLVREKSGGASPQYTLWLGKELYEAKRYDEAEKILSEAPENAARHLILALCRHDGFCDPEGFVSHCEKALELDPAIEGGEVLHLNLFSIYLSLSRVEEAARHLFAVAKTDPEKIDTLNIAWLADHYYKRLNGRYNDYLAEPVEEEEALADSAKGAFLYRHLEAKGEADEKELYKLSNLLGWLGKKEERLALLETLVRRQREEPGVKWQLPTRSLFALAHAKQEAGCSGEALGYYSELASEKKDPDPFVAAASALQRARLLHQTGAEPPETVLGSLQELQRRKTLIHEPVHLEAALEYAGIKSALAPPEKQDEQLLQLLIRAKEEFENRETIAAKDYHESRSKHPDKDRLYQAYQLLFDARIAYLEAKRAKNEQEARWKLEAAKTLYSSLASEKFALTRYLKEAARKGIEETSE